MHYWKGMASLTDQWSLISTLYNYFFFWHFSSCLVFIPISSNSGLAFWTQDCGGPCRMYIVQRDYQATNPCVICLPSLFCRAMSIFFFYWDAMNNLKDMTAYHCHLHICGTEKDDLCEREGRS